MDKNKLSVITISITPFDSAGRVDEAAFRAHLRRLREGGVSAYIAGSGSGEGYTLVPEEVDRLLAISVEELKGKVGVLADGTEPRTTREMVNYVRRVEKSGVDAVRIMPLDIGHASKPTTAELEKYHSTVIEATSSPLALTSHQAAGYVLPIDLIEKLASRYSHVVSVNYGGNDTTYLAELIRRMRGRIDVHCAGVTNGLMTLSLGGNGFMGSEGNIAPALAHSVIKAFEANDKEQLRERVGKLMTLALIVKRFGGSSLRGTKPLLNALGLPGGTLHEPRIPLEAAEIEKMRNAIKELNLPELAGRA